MNNIDFLSATSIQVSLGGNAVNVNSITYTSGFSLQTNNLHKINFVWDSSSKTCTLFIDDVSIGIGSGAITAPISWPSVFCFLSLRSGDAVRIANGITTEIIIEKSGVVTNRLYGYDFVDVIGSGTQTLTGSPENITIPSTTPEGLIDYFLNTIQNPYKTGLLNLGRYGHLGAEIGSTNSAIDGDNRSFIFLIDYANNGASQYLLSNRAEDNGLDIRLNVNDKFLVANEVAGAFLSTDVAASVSEEKTRVLVTLALNGDCVVYVETLGTAFNSAYTSKNLGAPGGGSAQPKLGIKSDDTGPFTGPINYIQVNSVIDLATANQIADYMEIQFSKI